jgi:hypothetical protein
MSDPVFKSALFGFGWLIETFPDGTKEPAVVYTANIVTLDLGVEKRGAAMGTSFFD